MPGTPDLARFEERLAAHGVKRGAPVYIRIFKLESELELWVQKGGRFERFATYPICVWSRAARAEAPRRRPPSAGGLLHGRPRAAQSEQPMHRSFSLGFPNVFDRAHGRTGSFIMVHGGCASIGCFAVTDPGVDEIWRMVTAALEQGQPRFPVHVFPFRMTERGSDFRKGYRWHGSGPI